MTPATTAGASRATRTSQPAARSSQRAKKASTTSAPSTKAPSTKAPSTKAASSKAAQPPVAKGAGRGKIAGSQAAAPAGADRKAKPAPAKAVARARAAAPTAGPAKSVHRPAPSGTRQTASSTRGAGSATTKAAGKSAAKETAKETAKKGSTSRATKEATKEKKVPGVSTVAKAKTPRQAAQATSGPPATASPQKKPASRRAATPAGPYAKDEKFLAEQRQLLEAERAVYVAQAYDLKAEADSLAQEREPGDVQFDEESGEGGTVTVDRERDLALSAQALAAVEEIDAALARIAGRTYGECERCQQPIPKPRLKALPYARLCVACKSGGLSRR